MTSTAILCDTVTVFAYQLFFHSFYLFQCSLTIVFLIAQPIFVLFLFNSWVIWNNKSVNVGCTDSHCNCNRSLIIKFEKFSDQDSDSKITEQEWSWSLKMRFRLPLVVVVSRDEWIEVFQIQVQSDNFISKSNPNPINW